MDKRTRIAARMALEAAERREATFGTLAFIKGPEARQARSKRLESRLWQDRGQPNMDKGQGDKLPTHLTARGKAKTSVTYRTVMTA